MPAQAVGTSIVSIVIDNEDFPGLATVTTTDPHGLTPGTFVSIPAVIGTAIGGGVSTSVIAGGITNITTATAHGLTPGAIVTLCGELSGHRCQCDRSSRSVGSPTQFTILQPGAAGMQVAQVERPRCNGLWVSLLRRKLLRSSRNSNCYHVHYQRLTTSMVLGQVPVRKSGMERAILSLRPVARPSSRLPISSTGQTPQLPPVGTVTPTDKKLLESISVLWRFWTRNGAITAYSPPVQFVSANGGQYASVSPTFRSGHQTILDASYYSPARWALTSTTSSSSTGQRS